MDMAVSKRGNRSLNAAALESLLRLRLFCNNGPAPVTYSEAEGLPMDPDEALSYFQQSDDANCVYCHGVIYSLNPTKNMEGGCIISACHHLVCHLCMPQFHQDRRKCPESSCTTLNRSMSKLKSKQGILVATSETPANRQRGNAKEPKGADVRYPETMEIPSKLQVFLWDIMQDMAGVFKPKW